MPPHGSLPFRLAATPPPPHHCGALPRCATLVYHLLFGLTAAPLWQYQTCQSLSSATPLGFLASCSGAHSPWIIAAPPGKPLGKQALFGTCPYPVPLLPSLGS